MFVDEGFGSLDSAALDQALTTLGSVAADGKLVALVSHVRQVAEIALGRFEQPDLRKGRCPGGSPGQRPVSTRYRVTKRAFVP